MVHEYDEYMLLFFDFMNIFDCHDYVVTFEDKTKAGLPTKPHFHGLIKMNYDNKVESLRDKIKKHFSNTGHSGTLSQVQIMKNIDEYNKALMYVLKQGDVQMTDFEDIDKLIKLSKEYNSQIKHDINTWKEHSKILADRIQKAHDKSKNIGRYTMLTIIHHYIYEWNKTNDEKHWISRPCNNTIMTFLQNTEFKINNQQDSLNIFLNDFDRDPSCRANTYEIEIEEHVNLYDLGDPLDYIDSDKEE